MDSKNIEHLIEKYWSCETSLEEEQILKEYFQNNLSEEHSESGLLFQYFAEEKKKQVDSILPDQELLEVIRSSEGDTKERVRTKEEKETHFLPWVGTLSKIAAVLIVLLSVTFYVYREQVKEETLTLLETDTYEDTQKAYEETVKALNLISKHLNKGKEQTMKLAKFHEAEEVVEESIMN